MKDNETLLKLIQIDNEINMRKRDALANYNKEIVHKKQMAFHKCSKRKLTYSRKQCLKHNRKST